MSHKRLVLVFLHGLTALLPGLAMMLGHWFPWRPILGRDLTKLESYIWGTAWIVGVSAAAMRISQRLDQPLTPDQCARLLELASVSAGLSTMLAYLVDYYSARRRWDAARQMAASQRGKHAD